MDAEIEQLWSQAKESRPEAVVFARAGDCYFVRGADVETVKREFGFRCFGTTVGFDTEQAWYLMKELALRGHPVVRAERLGLREVSKNGHKPVPRPRGKFIAVDPRLLFGEASLLRTRTDQRTFVIEDPSVAETNRYLEMVARSGEDRNVRPSPDKIVRPYKKDEEPKERQNPVNGEQAHMGGEERGRTAIRMPKAKREYLAGEMLAVLRDNKSLGYYRKVAAEVQEPHIFEALSAVKQMVRAGRIQKNRGALFVSLIRKRLTR